MMILNHSNAMKRALFIGINDYKFGPLRGCVRDARRLEKVFDRHFDGEPNFDCKTLLSPRRDDQEKTEMVITEKVLRKQIRDFFSRDADSAILFFAGHGAENKLGGYLVAEDAHIDQPGLPFSEVVKYANQSPIDEITIILDCCHSGHMGSWSMGGVVNQIPVAVIREGVSILSASRGEELAVETGAGGLFTSIICEALEGGAADVKGDVNVAGVYSYADQLLGAWDQRPIFKSHLSRMKSIRKCQPKVEIPKLRKLTTYFPTATEVHPLDPSYEPEAEPENLENERTFADLQKMTAAGLVVPVDAEHMYFAAMESKACRLTPLGRFYWAMVDGGKL